MDACPLDILLHVLCFLPLDAVLVLRRTCRTLHAATHERTLWALLFRTYVLEQHLPSPHAAPSLAALSAGELESLTRRALVLRRAWTAPQPVPRRHTTLTEPTARVLFLQFLPGRSNRWLISVRVTAHPRTYVLQCWDVASDHPQCVATLTHAEGPYGGVVLNSDPSSPAVLAMQSAQTETFSIRFDAQDPECAFVTEATIDGIRQLHLLSGSTLVTRRIDDGGALSLWDLADLRQEKLQLLNPSLLQPDDCVQAIHIAHDYALVVRVQSIEIYSTVPRPSLLSHHAAPVAYPLAQFKFQWRTDTVILCAQHAPPSSSPLLPPPIHLLVRFGSIYPWPVNVLHHYRLPPNPAWVHGRRRTPTPPSSPGTTSTPHSRVHTPTLHAHPRTSEYNLPYDLRPWPMHTIGSPVRLFGQSAMALGPYGTALWLDNHTETWMGPSERGQRLAGCVVRVGGDEGTSAASVGTGETEGARGMVAAPTADPVGAAYAKSNGASMLYGVCDDDLWTRVAMEEEAGRIALGHVDGTITLLEY